MTQRLDGESLQGPPDRSSEQTFGGATEGNLEQVLVSPRMLSEEFLTWLRPLLKQQLRLEGTSGGPDPIAMEEELLTTFQQRLGRYSVAKCMVPVTDRKLVRPEAFAFVPLLSPRVRSSNEPATFIDLPPAVKLYNSVSPGVYLDTRQAIGLSYDSWLIAVAGAGLDKEHGTLIIKQLQDTTDIHKFEGKPYYKTGLHNGFLWRDTLVTAWERIGADIGVHAVVIQSHQNNRWSTVRMNGKHAYDDVADRMYYTQLLNHDWIKFM